LAGVWSIGEVKGDSAKVQSGAELRVQRWKYEKGAKRGTGDRKVSAGGGREDRSRFGRHLANGRDAVAPLPDTAKAARLARSANPT
jgi:ribosomal protein L19E